LRAADELVRYGGEEFVVLLPGVDGREAAAVIERLRPVTPAGQTFSAGVATWDTVETSDELVARADRSLYRAKEHGRDRTSIDELV
jgi:diguanylate cyclase